MRHIVEEFHRVTLMHPEVGFTFISNEKEIFHLFPGNLKQRIVALFGNAYNERLLPVSQQADTVSIEGFIGKATSQKKPVENSIFSLTTALSGIHICIMR